MKKYCFILLVIFFSVEKSFATTWDEPWAKDVIREATSFVLAKVISVDDDKGIKIYILKTLGGTTLTDTVHITGFSLLKLCSSSGGHGAGFQTMEIDSCYFFITKNNKGDYCIPTPTTGFDYAYENKVIATYRHSYHQASVPVDVYEKTMTAIYNHYHGLPFDRVYMTGFVQEQLQKSPAGFSENEIATFFLQHAALESIYHLRLDVPEAMVLPFLHDKNNFHNQVSAARALSAFNTASSKKELLAATGDTTRSSFVRVMCVWSLQELKPRELKAALKKLEDTAPQDSNGFGGNIMDPRVCTRVPSLRTALKELVARL